MWKRLAFRLRRRRTCLGTRERLKASARRAQRTPSDPQLASSLIARTIGRSQERYKQLQARSAVGVGGRGSDAETRRASGRAHARHGHVGDGSDVALEPFVPLARDIAEAALGLAERESPSGSMKPTASSGARGGSSRGGADERLVDGCPHSSNATASTDLSHRRLPRKHDVRRSESPTRAASPARTFPRT